MAQVVLVGITCFATVGMFSAVSNLGAGGTEDIALSDTANGVLYGTFAISGLISGGISNCKSLVRVEFDPMLILVQYLVRASLCSLVL